MVRNTRCWENVAEKAAYFMAAEGGSKEHSPSDHFFPNDQHLRKAPPPLASRRGSSPCLTGKSQAGSRKLSGLQATPAPSLPLYLSDTGTSTHTWLHSPQKGQVGRCDVVKPPLLASNTNEPRLAQATGQIWRRLTNSIGLGRKSNGGGFRSHGSWYPVAFTPG